MQKCNFLKVIRLLIFAVLRFTSPKDLLLLAMHSSISETTFKMEQYPVLADYQTPDLNRSFVKVRAKSITNVAWEHPFSEDQFVDHFTSIAISQPRVNWKHSETSEWGWIWPFPTPVFLANITQGWEWIRLRAHFPSSGLLLSDYT